MFAPSLESSDIPGVSHCDELFFLWNPYYNVSYPLQGEDRKVEEDLVSIDSKIMFTGRCH